MTKISRSGGIIVLIIDDSRRSGADAAPPWTQDNLPRLRVEIWRQLGSHLSSQGERVQYGMRRLLCDQYQNLVLYFSDPRFPGSFSFPRIDREGRFMLRKSFSRTCEKVIPCSIHVCVWWTFVGGVIAKCPVEYPGLVVIIQDVENGRWKTGISTLIIMKSNSR